MGPEPGGPIYSPPAQLRPFCESPHHGQLLRPLPRRRLARRQAPGPACRKEVPEAELHPACRGHGHKLGLALVQGDCACFSLRRFVLSASYVAVRSRVDAPQVKLRLYLARAGHHFLPQLQHVRFAPPRPCASCGLCAQVARVLLRPCGEELVSRLLKQLR